MKGWIGKLGGGGIAAALAVALAAGVIGYRLLGSEAQVPPAASADPLATLEQRAAADPANAGAWQELGFAYFQLNRYADAATAYEKATRADPNSAVLWSSLGEARVMASEREPMPAPAIEAFRKAASLDSKDPRARYFLAVEQDLAGDHEGAIAAWLALLAETPPGAPWEADLKRTIEQVGKIHAIPVDERLAAAQDVRPVAPAMPGIPGPSQEQIAAASALRPAEQQQMAEQMVARLAARLEQDPQDVEGWIMLMRSYETLGRAAQARAALGKALAANPGARDRLSSAAATLGIS